MLLQETLNPCVCKHDNSTAQMFQTSMDLHKHRKNPVQSLQMLNCTRSKACKINTAHDTEIRKIPIKVSNCLWYAMIWNVPETQDLDWNLCQQLMTCLQNGVISYFSVLPHVDTLDMARDRFVLAMHESKLQYGMKYRDAISIVQENTEENINCLHIINLTCVDFFQ